MNYDIKKIETILDKLLLNRNTRVDRFDGDYIDDFHFIMKENYNVVSLKDKHNEDFNELKKIFINKIKDISDFSKILKDISEINFSKYRPLESDDKTKSENKYNQTVVWNETKGLRQDKQNVDKLNQLQIEYSLLSGGKNSVGPETFWYRDNLTEDKNLLFDNICKNQEETKKVLCLGPRWSEEIIFIKNTFNCDAIGLDLFSNNSSLVISGDMHKMPFKDNTFDVVYQKNTFNKSYDIRKCLDECVRVLKNGGVIVSDEILSYKIGVNEIARTSINNNQWYTSYLSENVDQVLINKEVNINVDWAEKAGLYAVRIKK